MSFEKLRALISDNAEALKVSEALEQSVNGNVERINILEKTNADLLGEVKNFKQGNSLVKESLGLEQLNQETLSEALNRLKSAKGDEKLTSEIENLKGLIDKANNEKTTIVSDYESKISNMALTNAIRDLGIGSLASTPIAEKMILDHLKQGATLDGDNIVYRNEDGTTVYNGTNIMTPQTRLESLKADDNWKPFLKPDVASGSGARESNVGGGSQNPTMGGDKDQRREAIKAKFNL